jgi:hypothetical protein
MISQPQPSGKPGQAPTRSAASRIFRPTISVAPEQTQVLVEQTAVVDPEHLGSLVGHITARRARSNRCLAGLVLELD